MYVHPHQEALWAAAFGIEDIRMIFDLDSSETAIAKIDQAIQVFNHSPDSIRHLLNPGDVQGLIGNRRVLEQMRATLADHPDASISGALDELPTTA